MATKQFRAVITDAATHTVIPTGWAIREIVISPDLVGTAYTLKIQDQSSPVFVLVPKFTMAVPTDGKPTLIQFDNPQRMDKGVDVVTAGTPAGSVSVWITAE